MTAALVTASPRGGSATGPGRPSARGSLLDAVADLRRDVEATHFPLALDGVEHARGRRRQLLDQLDDHLLPRLRELSAPAMVVVAGSTGAGKSTLVNSLLGEEVSAAGVLRPTTRRPVLVHHPDDHELIADHPLLAIVDVVARPGVPRGLAVVDAPDLDSLLSTNRSMAHRLLEAADLWVFVTTAARYGDALPWQVLDRAAARGTSMAMVLNRVPDDALVTVRSDLLTRLRDRGMSAVPLFLVPDAGPHEGLLEPRVVAPILRWLTMVAGPDRARSVIARTQRGSLAALRPWVDELAEAVQAQVDARVALEAQVERALAGPAEHAAAAVLAGAVADGPVRSRWAALAGRSGPLGGGWGARRGQAQRVEALRLLAVELAQAGRVVLVAARRSGALAVHRALEASPVPPTQASVAGGEPGAGPTRPEDGA
ncbi:MAG TPA: dynamin family protein, partial [Actinotalea sp.]|nr:dynamin family protein [Actinotalea sp.]